MIHYSQFKPSGGLLFSMKRIIFPLCANPVKDPLTKVDEEDIFLYISARGRSLLVRVDFQTMLNKYKYINLVDFII